MSGKQFKLYWVSTPENEEDWFILARNKTEAQRYHESREAFPRDTATAELICALPAPLAERFKVEGPRWPEPEIITACGGEFLVLHDNLSAQEAFLCEVMGIGRRAVRFGEKIYVEGNVVLAQKEPAA